MADEREEKENFEPLVIFYDSEASNGNVYYGDVIEIAATCHPGVVVGSFESLINTKQRLGSFAINESGITEDKLKGKPFINEVMIKFLDWIEEMVVLAQKKNNTNYFPVLCAHGGYQFDFLILFANLERKGVSYRKFKDCNIHFADSFLFCQQLQKDGNQHLQDTKLSIDGLFHNFFPKHTIKERHRAMGDVKAMVKIFTQTPLKSVLHLMTVSTTKERVKYFVSQSSSKEQQLILEEKMSSLDACSRNMCSKRLIREGFTYDILKTVFQKCSSYMEFWQILKKIGIDRKVARLFTSQFGAMGLQNQGSLGYTLNAAMQNGSLSNGPSNGSSVEGNDTHKAVNGNAEPNDGAVDRNPRISVSLKSNAKNSTRTKRDPFSSNGVMGTAHADRATSSSRAFEERPLDYAVTSSADERAKVYAKKSNEQHNDVKDSPTVLSMANGVEGNSSEIKENSTETTTGALGTETGRDSTKNSESVAFQNASTSQDPSVCNGNENWDSEIENSVNRGRFVLRFNEIIPVSIGIEDICSSSGDSATEQHEDVKAMYPQGTPARSGANQPGKRIVGNVKESAGNNNRNGGGHGQGRGHGQSRKDHDKSGGISKSRSNNEKQSRDNSVNDKVIKKEVPGSNTKSKGTITLPGDDVTQRDREEGSPVSSTGKDIMPILDNETEVINKSMSSDDVPKVTDGTHNKILRSSVEKVGQKGHDDQKGQKRKNKVSSKKKPSSVTFVTPKDSIDFSPESLPDGVDMTTVYVGDVPILVPVEKLFVSPEDRLDQIPAEDKPTMKEDNTTSMVPADGSTNARDGSTISRDGSTISREDGDTPKDERFSSVDGNGHLRNGIADEDGSNSVKQSDRVTEVIANLEDVHIEQEGFMQETKGLEETSPETSVPDKVPSTTVSESLSSSSYETSDTGSSMDYGNQRTPPPLDGEKKNDSERNPLPQLQPDDIVSSLGSGDHALPLAEQDNQQQPIISNTEIHSACVMEAEDTTIADQDAEKSTTEQGELPIGPSTEMDVTPNVPTQQQMNGLPEGSWPSSDVGYPNPSMFPVPPPQFPFHVPYPTGMPPFGFYPHMMPMIPSPQTIPYTSMPFGAQGMVPFGGFPTRFAMPVPMFQPSMYPNVQEAPPPTVALYEQECTQQATRGSPDVLGIPNRNPASEQQNNKTQAGLGGISNVIEAYSSTSDEHSARSSPFPVGDSSGKTTPITTPYRSPNDDSSPGAQYSGNREEKAHFSKDRRRTGYRKTTKNTRNTRFQKDERFSRASKLRSASKKDLPEQPSARGDEEASGGRSQGSEDVTVERKKVQASDNILKEQRRSPKDIKESVDKDVKWGRGCPRTPTKSPKSEQLTPPRREERDMKSSVDASKLSPEAARDIQQDHGDPQAMSRSRHEPLPPRKLKKDMSPKTSPSDSKSDQTPPSRQGERNVSSHSAVRQTSSTNSRSDQTSKFTPTVSSKTSSSKLTSGNDMSRSFQTNGIKKDHIESPKSSATNSEARPSRTSTAVRVNPNTSTSTDKAREDMSRSSKDATKPSSADLSSSSDLTTQASRSDTKSVNPVSEKETALDNSRGKTDATPSVIPRKEASEHEPRNSNKSVKWPQSALVTQKSKEPPKPQRELTSRKRIREPWGSGGARRVESHHESSNSHKREGTRTQPKATAMNDYESEESPLKESKVAREKERSKEPFSARGKDFKSNSDDKIQKNSTGRTESKRNVNYRDILLGKQGVKTYGNERSNPKGSATDSGNDIRDGGSSTREERSYRESAINSPSQDGIHIGTTSVKNQPLAASGPITNLHGTPQDLGKTSEKNYRKEKKPLDRPVNASRGSAVSREVSQGSTVSRDSTPRTNNMNQRNRNYDNNNNSNMQSRNAMSNAPKSY